MTKSISFGAFGETLNVESVGPVYVAPCCGAQYGSLRDAVRREIERFGRDSDADDEAIEEAIDAAMEELAIEDPEYVVEVRSTAGWTTHSTHENREAAQDQADLVSGRVIVREAE